MDTAKLQKLVKPLVRSVLLKVHPDFFAHDPVAKQINQGSVQRLQDLMAPLLKDNTHAATKNTAATDPPLEFFCKADNGLPQSPVSFAFTRVQMHRSEGNGTNRHQQLIAQRAKDLLTLCSRLGVTASEATTAEIELIVGKTVAATKSTSANDSELRAARAREALENYRRRKNAPDPNKFLLEKLRLARWSPNVHGSKGARVELDRSKVFFANSVDPRGYTRIVQRIEANLDQLLYDRWCSLPLMVVDNWRHAFKGSATRYPGFVVIPADFSVQGNV
ncbi:hypothetical protein H4R99_003222 [Coemansia sp. RSA 1722]|nr:hypothetical protein LPJ57_004163 [Coemansia sp. RSA 486]KAJ2233605.1 hypothetical protein IWW45_004046 [Coemansia sp. RSA 485]KAJ2600748.1 hypothetical protein H4R99_003222 [Coemansia sp. RSA 1722]